MVGKGSKTQTLKVTVDGINPVLPVIRSLPQFP